MQLRQRKKQIDYWASIYMDCLFAKQGFFVVGYTKSGTNWLRNLTRYYLEIDQPEKEGFSKSFFRQRVHHLHRFVPLNFFQRRTVYMVRDGRDTVVSRYFTMVKQNSQTKMKADFELYSGVVPTEENIKSSLASYIKFLVNYKKSTMNYKKHILTAENKGLYMIKYEDLKNDTVKIFSDVLKHFLPSIVLNKSKINQAIQDSSIASSIKKNKSTGFFRKDAGKANGWKDHFNRNSAEVFQEFAGDILIRYGYETNTNWVNEIS